MLPCIIHGSERGMLWCDCPGSTTIQSASVAITNTPPKFQVLKDGLLFLPHVTLHMENQRSKLFPVTERLSLTVTSSFHSVVPFLAMGWVICLQPVEEKAWRRHAYFCTMKKRLHATSHLPLIRTWPYLDGSMTRTHCPCLGSHLAVTSLHQGRRNTKVCF